MKYTMNELNNIVKTLPIGYYLGQGTKVEVKDDITTSKINIMTREISISYSQIQQTLEESMNEVESEEMIRSNLYHELSHAILTPKTLKPNYQRNVFEDERIETLLANYYMNVNFKKECQKMNNHIPGENPKDANQAFYFLVRFREGEESWLKELENLISEYSYLNYLSQWYYVENYAEDIDDFYSRFIRDYKEKEESKKEESKKEESKENQEKEESKENQEKEESKKEESKENQEKENQEEKESKEEKENGQYNEEETSEETSEEETKEALIKKEDTKVKNEDSFSSPFTKEQAKELIDKVINKYNDNSLNEEINAILRNISITSKNNGSAINSYSGIFNPRSVMRDDYKYFVQQNREGHQKQFSKIHLNLFIDVSGSFSGSKEITNKVLFALSEFEKQNKNFSFDIITMGMGEKIESKKNREINPEGGNRLDNQIFDIFKKVQNPNEYNYNIVLFDGDAESDALTDDEHKGKPFKAFDRNNVTLITNSANEHYIKNNSLNSCKVIYTKKYVEELRKHILNTLKLMAR